MPNFGSRPNSDTAAMLAACILTDDLGAAR
jgi:hypothetical protein